MINNRYSRVTPFRYWCQMVIPLVYDDSLSYYELLNKVVDYLNKVIEDNNIMIENIEGLSNAFDELQNFVDTYFENLDVQEEIDNKLDEMVTDGTFTSIVEPLLEDYQSQLNLLEARVDNLTENITPGSTTGDAELIDIRTAYNGDIYDNAGNSVRGQVQSLVDNLIEYNSFDYFSAYGRRVNASRAGVTYTWSDSNINKCHVEGTATSSTAFNNLFEFTSGLPDYFKAGEKYYVQCSGFIKNELELQIFFYVDGSSSYINISSSQYFEIPSNATGILIRLITRNGKTVNTDIVIAILTNSPLSLTNDRLYAKSVLPYIVNDTLTLADVTEDGFYVIPTQYTVTDIPMGLARCTALTVENFSDESSTNKFRKQIAEDIFNVNSKSYYRFSKIDGAEYYGWREIGSSQNSDELKPTGDDTDVTNDILSILTTRGVCKLTSGDYYVKNLDMPENTSIIGCGSSTRIILKDGGEYAIKMNTECLVTNAMILGSLDSLSPTSTIGNRHGIYWKAQYTVDQQYPARAKCSNLWIANFTGGGITFSDTSANVQSSLKCENITINNCTVGINIAWRSEFHEFTNVSATRCYYGCINNGGNNMFVNCNFSANSGIGFLMDNSQSQSPNNSHGSAIGCIFNHTASNNGVGIKVLNCDNGFIFSGCQIFYSQIQINDSDGVVVSSSNFGNNNCDISVSGGGVILFSDNLHGGAPPITITNNQNVHFTNCYVRSTGELVSA